MSDFITAAGQDEWINLDGYNLDDDLDWVRMLDAAAQASWTHSALTVANSNVHTTVDPCPLNRTLPSNEHVSLDPWPISQQHCPALSGVFDGLATDFQPESSASAHGEKDWKSATRTNLTGPKVKAFAIGHNMSRRLKCPYNDCTHEGTFHREYELQRHVRVKHEGKKPFQCPFAGCFNRTEVTSYARADKLTSHIRSVHARHADRLLECCVNGCTKTALPLDLLGVHIARAHGVPNYNDSSRRILAEKSKALRAAASTAYRRCPLWRCATTTSLAKFMQHLTTHTIEEFRDGLEALREDGYLISEIHTPKSHPDLSGSGFSGESSPMPVLIRVACPACYNTYATHEELEDHIDEEHLISGEHRQHFIAWRRFARASQNFWPVGKNGMWYRWDGIPSSNEIECPSCQATLIGYWADTHHFDMLANIEELEGLKPYRRAILKLYPNFATHRIWDDLA